MKKWDLIGVPFSIYIVMKPYLLFIPLLFFITTCKPDIECDQPTGVQYQSGLVLADDVQGEERELNQLLYCQIAPEKSVVVQSRAHLPFMVNGVTYPLNETTYLIQLKDGGERQERLWTLFHEWGHVYQFESQMLQAKPVRWMGQPVEFQQSWSQRPWEQSADTMALVYWRKYLPDEEPPSSLVKRTMQHMDPRDDRVE